MRRADRLFQIIQVLRRSRNPLTADAIAEELETSKRTIYRDIATLIGQRVPIRGEAGMGYILEKGFDLPPLMLTPDEIEAAVLGAQWVAGHADPVLARAAEDRVAEEARGAVGRAFFRYPTRFFGLFPDFSSLTFTNDLPTCPRNLRQIDSRRTHDLKLSTP